MYFNFKDSLMVQCITFYFALCMFNFLYAIDYPREIKLAWCIYFFCSVYLKIY